MLHVLNIPGKDVCHLPIQSLTPGAQIINIFEELFLPFSQSELLYNVGLSFLNIIGSLLENSPTTAAKVWYPLSRQNKMLA